MALSPSSRTKVFIIYSHADKEWLERLKRHLKPLVREGQLDCWDDTHIKPGDDWKQEIRAALDRAQVAVLLISAHFFASDFIDETELPPLLAAAQAKGVRILPVILSKSRHERGLYLARFQDVNSPDRSLIKMPRDEQEEVLDRFAQVIESAFVKPSVASPRGLGNAPEKPLDVSVELAPLHDVHFTVYHPKEIKPEVWSTLLAYMHILKMRSTVEADAKQRLKGPHSRRTAEATRSIARGTEIVAIPELPGCRFNPPSARLLWLEDWHRVEFRLQAQPHLAGFELGKAVNGRVAFYVETVLIGEVPIWTCISDEADIAAANAPASPISVKPYEAIFISYAHEDSAVVDRLGKAYKVLGMEFLRDVEKLRSGEKWNPALLAMIERANIFQLYWSRAAKHSRYVKQEWRHALKQEKSHFIRPLYWQVPMPPPPRQLAQLHFSYLELDN